MAASPLTAARYAIRLSDHYKALGDAATRNRDATSAALVFAAGAATLANTTSVTVAEAAAVAIGGLTLNEAAKYVDSGSAAGAFFKASAEMVCIGSVSVEVLGSDATNDDIAASAVIIQFIRQTELRLRAALQRSEPDYIDLSKAIRLGAGSLGLESAPVSDNATSLRIALADCFQSDDVAATRAPQDTVSTSEDVATVVLLPNEGDN